MIIHALQTGSPFISEILKIGYCIRSKCTSDKYFLYKWRTRLQSMYNHMVRRTASVISPFYSLLPGYSAIQPKFCILRMGKKLRNKKCIKGEEYELIFSGSRIRRYSFQDFIILFRGFYPITI